MIELSLTLSDNIFKTKAGLQVLAMGGLPKTAAAVKRATIHAQKSWIDEAGNVLKYSTGAYVENIKVLYPLSEDGLLGKIVNRLDYARYLEEGTGPFDLKKMLQTSHQVRITKKGKRYLIIPFRHGTPRQSGKEAGKGIHRATMPSMPLEVSRRAKELTMSQRTETYYELSKQLQKLSPRDIALMRIHGDPFGPARRYAGGLPQAQRFMYEWGGHLQNLGAGLERYEGMYRFLTQSGSQYITFRVMSENQEGKWMHPGIPRLQICKKTADRIRLEVLDILKQGWLEDLSCVKIRK